jgi:hypothetical protein
MEGKTGFLDRPAHLGTGGTGGTARCGLPAEVEARYILRSTGGPVECARICCLRGHWFNGPIESLTTPVPAAVGTESAASVALPPLTVHTEPTQRHSPGIRAS